MALSSQLISQFAKTINAANKKQNENTSTTLYGETVVYNGQTYVKLDGSELLTPVETTTSVKDGDRVTVKIENHSATVTGNLSDPSASTTNVTEVIDQITEFEIVMAHKVTAEELEATNAYIENLKAISAKFEEMSAITAEIEELQAKLASIDHLTATDIEAINAELESLRAKFGSFGGITTEDLNAVNAEIDNLKAYFGEFTYVSTDVLEAMKADIKQLDAEKLNAEQADLIYANIDFANIGKAAMEYFYANSGLIENVIVGDASITGTLAGVTIKGDLIEGETIVADKLVIKGEDGLYYKLNMNGETVEAKQTEYNSINGSLITAHTITATQINVNDLVAFDATIGGFKITEKAIFSEVKDYLGNTTRGTYLDVDGQVNFGDSEHFVKYVRDDNGQYHLTISADTILYSLNGTQRSIADLGILTEYVKIGVHEGEPCIELGEFDSDFKLIITNTRIMFMEGTAVPAYISGQTLIAQNVEVEQSLKQGGFSWVSHDGNLGLMWTGSTTASVGYSIDFTSHDIGVTSANLGESLDTTVVVRPFNEASMTTGSLECVVYYGTPGNYKGEYDNYTVDADMVYDSALATYVFTFNIHIPLVTDDIMIDVIYF